MDRIIDDGSDQIMKIGKTCLKGLKTFVVFYNTKI